MPLATTEEVEDYNAIAKDFNETAFKLIGEGRLINHILVIGPNPLESEVIKQIHWMIY